MDVKISSPGQIVSVHDLKRRMKHELLNGPETRVFPKLSSKFS